MLIGWAFAYLIEGASGFGTPAALASPILLSMGHPKLETVCCLLLMNIFATVFGAVGTPIWFAFGGTFLLPDGTTDEAALKSIGLFASIGLLTAAVLLVPLVVKILVPWKQVRANIVFIELSVLSCSLTNLAIATFSYDFPTLIGGIVGIAVTSLLVHFRVGLTKGNGAQTVIAVVESPHLEHASASVAPAPRERSLRGLDRGPIAIRHEDSASYHHAVEIERQVSGKGTTLESATIPPAQAVRAPVPPPEPRDISVTSISSTHTQPHTQHGKATAKAKVGTVASGETIVPGDQAREGHSPIIAPAHGIEMPEVQEEHEQHSAHAGSGPPPTSGSAYRQRHVSASQVHVTDEERLHDEAAEAAEVAMRVHAESGILRFVMRTCPLWLTVLLLVLTRIEQIGIKDNLKRSSPEDWLFHLELGKLGTLWLSSSFVIGLGRILDVPSSNWQYELFFVPALIPFAIAGSSALVLFRKELTTSPKKIVGSVLTRMKGPTLSLVGAIALVSMLRGTPSDLSAPAYVIGVVVSGALSHGWIILAGLLGALGSFFSGSTTVSNLTFGSVQKSAAELLGVNPAAMCALQACGASFGNAICLNNIIATSTVVGLKVSEGEIMKRTGPIVCAAWIIGTLILIPFIYGVA
jgi:L-lactate permease